MFQARFQFATVDLSAFYFDIRKDALYCDAADAPRRRASRTVLDLLYHRLTTWLAPMLVFTMEEVWLERFPGEESSVHLQDFPETPQAWRDDALAEDWAKIRGIRRVVTAALEIQRTDKVIGASLEAAPVVELANPALAELAGRFEMADICITSDLTLKSGPVSPGAFTLEDAGIGVVFEKARGKKCLRCWKILPDVGLHSPPFTCARCNAALGRWSGAERSGGAVFFESAQGQKSDWTIPAYCRPNSKGWVSSFKQHWRAFLSDLAG